MLTHFEISFPERIAASVASDIVAQVSSLDIQIIPNVNRVTSLFQILTPR